MRKILFGLLAATAFAGTASAAAFDRPQYWGDGVPVTNRFTAGDVAISDAVPSTGTFGTELPAGNSGENGLPGFVVKEHGSR